MSYTLHPCMSCPLASLLLILLHCSHAGADRPVFSRSTANIAGQPKRKLGSSWAEQQGGKKLAPMHGSEAKQQTNSRLLYVSHFSVSVPASVGRKMDQEQGESSLQHIVHPVFVCPSQIPVSASMKAARSGSGSLCLCLAVLVILYSRALFC